MLDFVFLRAWDKNKCGEKLGRQIINWPLKMEKETAFAGIQPMYVALDQEVLSSSSILRTYTNCSYLS